ncbi:DHA2 family efflux MFS transporter permease subunit [Hahella sp. HN01]|uniref:DHA2 family efflux MFS transporter permease subunit n=1 Tax=Hahella sp. HN01 TaxID=2847262 RepID=UPI001C1ED4D2|nr:DHA2 family efflux MFS transporter permease subunit [Hahella sp. HN01]MBU6950094.1 DHA2 family efflux MFS transporter permease subunit [Hahella sp. HN01]
MQKTVNPWLIAPLVALAAFMEVLDISIANVSLQHIAGSLGAGPEETTWILTSYLVTNAIALPIAGWLSDYFGRTRFFIGSIIGFTLASLACGMAPGLEMLIIFRAVQGLAGGALQPVSQAILADSFPLEKRGMAFAMYGIAVVAAPAIGPTLGGWITDEFSWRWIFLINVPVGIVLIMLVKRFLPDEPANHDGSKVDYFGFALIAIGLGCLQWMLDTGQREDWFESPQIVALAVIVVVALLTYIVRSFDQKNPIVDLTLYRYPNFAMANVIMFMMGFVLFGSTALLPLLMQTLMGYSAFDAGLVLSPGGFAIMFMMPIVGRLVGAVDSRILLMLGLSVSSLALWNLGDLTLSVSRDQLALARVWQTLGLAFLFIPTTSSAYVGLPTSANNQAAAMLSFMRNLGGGVGIALLMTFLDRVATVNRGHLVANTSPVSEVWSQHYMQLQQITGDATRALMMANQQVAEQARFIAFMDSFKMLAILFALLIPLVWKLKPLPRSGVGAPQGAH